MGDVGCVGEYCRPISSFARCVIKLVTFWCDAGSCLILARVGVIGIVFVDTVVEQMFLLSSFDFDPFECVDGDDGGGSVAAVHVSVTGHSSDLILIVAGAVDEVVVVVAGFEFLFWKFILFALAGCAVATLVDHDWMLTSGFFVVVFARFEIATTKFSSLDSRRFPSATNGRRGGLTLTASDSIFMRKAATTMVEKGCRHFLLLKLRIRFRSEAMQGGGFMANTSSRKTFLPTDPALNCLGRFLIR